MPATVSGETSTSPAGNPFDFKINATRSLYVDAGSDPPLPLGMFVFTNVNRSATVFCVKPVQNASPVRAPLPSPVSVWHREQTLSKVAFARSACGFV